jgi:hypothetical protein
MSILGKKLESIRTANVQKASAPKKPEKKPEPLPLSQTLAEFVKKTESMQAGFVEVEDVEEESGYKNVVKLDNKTFKDEFRKVLYFTSNYILYFNNN